MTLGERIKACRLKSRLSQEKVAELVGVSRQAVTKWETGQSAPNTENLFRLAEIFGTSVDLLVSTEEKTESLAQQLHALHLAEENRKAEERTRRRKHNVRMALLAAGCYFAIFLTGKLFSLPLGDRTVTAWLLGTPPGDPSYLYAWLLSKGMFLYCALLSCLPCLFGKVRFGFSSLAGFSIGLPLGEFFGPHPDGAFYGTTHYGWAIWMWLFILGIIMGIILQRFPKETLSLRSKKLWIWLGIYLVAIIGIVVLVQLNKFP